MENKKTLLDFNYRILYSYLRKLNLNRDSYLLKITDGSKLIKKVPNNTFFEFIPEIVRKVQEYVKLPPDRLSRVNNIITHYGKRVINGKFLKDKMLIDLSCKLFDSVLLSAGISRIKVIKEEVSKNNDKEKIQRILSSLRNTELLNLHARDTNNVFVNDEMIKRSVKAEIELEDENGDYYKIGIDPVVENKWFIQDGKGEYAVQSRTYGEFPLKGSDINLYTSLMTSDEKALIKIANHVYIYLNKVVSMEEKERG